MTAEGCSRTCQGCEEPMASDDLVCQSCVIVAQDALLSAGRSRTVVVQDLHDVSRAATARLCAWCSGPIRPGSRRDAKTCSTSCRQARHRFGTAQSLRPAAATALRFAYADPPYPGLARRYYEGHPDFDGEVDHEELLSRLQALRLDGWALSTSAAALPMVLRLPSCPPGVRVAAWVTGLRGSSRSGTPASSWEPVVVWGGRADPSRVDGRRDSLVHAVRPRTTRPGEVIGAKPAVFCDWLFDLLGMLPGDELLDLYPGSGGVAESWAVASRRVQLEHSSASDAARRQA